MINIIAPEGFNQQINGQQVQLFTLKNNNDLICQITNYGGRVISLYTPDKNGELDNIVLGFDHIDDYINAKERYYGAIVGRYANRIAKAKYKYDNQVIHLSKNNGEHHLHGGVKGFQDVVWTVKSVSKNQLVLSYLSKDGEEGYPGNLQVETQYRLNDANELIIHYTATTDKKTPVSLSHHSYFNLGKEKTINNHKLTINADTFLPTSIDKIPTGEILAVENTKMDFRQEKAIQKQAYDHTWVLNSKGDLMTTATKAIDTQSGRTIEVFTSEKGIQFYTADFLIDPTNTHLPRAGFCLETQAFPNSLNQANFPTTILTPEETYKHICIYKIGLT